MRILCGLDMGLVYWLRVKWIGYYKEVVVFFYLCVIWVG